MFTEILGHETSKRLIQKAVEAGRMPPALLLSGPEGVGKFLLARALGRALLCTESGSCEPQCVPCRRANEGGHPDLIVVQPSTLVIKIDQIREVVRQIMGRPFEARRRVVVLDQAHLLTEEAANSLLKSLEEPPPTSHLILVTAAPQALLPTIRSRCQGLRLGPLPASTVEEYLKEKHGQPAEEARLRASLSGGSIGAALAWETETHRSVRALLLDLLEKPPGGAERAEVADRLAELEDIPAALITLRTLLRDMEVLRLGAGPQSLLNADESERLSRLARAPLAGRASAFAAAVEETIRALRGNANKLLAMDVLMERLVEPG